MTCGVLSRGLLMETRGIGFNFVLLIWPREGTWRVQKSVLTQLNIVNSPAFIVNSPALRFRQPPSLYE